MIPRPSGWIPRKIKRARGRRKGGMREKNRGAKLTAYRNQGGTETKGEAETERQQKWCEMDRKRREKPARCDTL